MSPPPLPAMITKGTLVDGHVSTEESAPMGTRLTVPIKSESKIDEHNEARIRKRKENISEKVREDLWTRYVTEKRRTCSVNGCKNIITIWNFKIACVYTTACVLSYRYLPVCSHCKSKEKFYIIKQSGVNENHLQRKQMKRMVWKSTFGETQTSCKVKGCKEKISWWTFEAGHDLAEAKGGKIELSNLRPICRGCNNSMKTLSYNEWEKVTTLTRGSFCSPKCTIM